MHSGADKEAERGLRTGPPRLFGIGTATVQTVLNWMSSEVFHRCGSFLARLVRFHDNVIRMETFLNYAVILKAAKTIEFGVYL